MPVRVFTEDEKINIRKKLLSVGFPLLKEYGMVHMSVSKIAKAAEIGTGTFYRFFESKEDYIMQLIQYRREQLMEAFIPAEVREEKRKLTKEEVRRFIELIADKNNSVYANMNLQDESNLLKEKPMQPNLEHEKQVSGVLLGWADISVEKVNFPLLANMMKVLAITAQAKENLHEEAYDSTIEVLIDDIMDLLYGDA